MNASGCNGYELPVRIQMIVCSHYGLNIENTNEPCRKRELVNARYVAMYFIKQYTKLSLAEIGEHFPHGDHATVLHGIRRISGEIDIYPQFRKEIETLNQKIRAIYNSEFKRYENYETDNV